MKFKYVILVVSLASLALLYLLTGLSQPPTIALTDAPHYEGQHVIVTGRVQHYQPTSNGAQLIIINAPDTETTLTIYTTQPTAIDYGDLVSADGTIEQYQGAWELSVDTTQAITILQHDNTSLYPSGSSPSTPTNTKTPPSPPPDSSTPPPTPPSPSKTRMAQQPSWSTAPAHSPPKEHSSSSTHASSSTQTPSVTPSNSPTHPSSPSK